MARGTYFAFWYLSSDGIVFFSTRASHESHAASSGHVVQAPLQLLARCLNSEGSCTPRLYNLASECTPRSINLALERAPRPYTLALECGLIYAISGYSDPLGSTWNSNRAFEGFPCAASADRRPRILVFPS